MIRLRWNEQLEAFTEFYSVQDYWTIGARREVQQGKTLADIAKAAGVQLFVNSSVGGADRNSGITHFESKWEVEKHVRSLKLPATILRPAGFMEMYYVLEVETGILKGTLADPIRSDKLYQTIATDDVGAFATLAFEPPKTSSEWSSRSREVSSPT